MALELRNTPPSSSRTLGEPSERHQAMIDGCNEQLREPVTGVRTSNGVIEGLFPLVSTGLDLTSALVAQDRFICSLNADEITSVRFPIDSDEWRRWSNIHRFLLRHGLLLDELNSDQRELALAIVSDVLSPGGLSESRGVMQLNETIQEISERFDQNGFPEFGEWMYWISLMGEASPTEPWGWQFDGHHLNINCFIVNDQIVVTPFFLGSEPLEADIGKYAGVKILDREERVALELIGALNDEQRDIAVVSATMPPGLFTGAFRDNAVLDYEGISYGALSSEQQRRLLELIEVYVGRLRSDIAKIKMDEVRQHLGDTYFSWMGGTTTEDVFYYRVHSPVILLEFDHEAGIVFQGAEPMKSHIHTMMRTPNGNDYGKDYLRQHREQHPHHA